jgi:hypothetical protein
MDMSEITKEQLDSLRELAENLTSKKFGNVKDPAKLQAIIDVARADKEDEDEDAPKVLSMAAQNRKREIARKEATKLLRVNITAMAPFEKQLKGAYFDVGNSLVGNIRRFIPYDVDWHCEAMLLEHIKDRKYRTKKEWKDPITRKIQYENIFVRAYGVVELDALSAQELAEHSRAMKSREYKIG